MRNPIKLLLILFFVIGCVQTKKNIDKAGFGTVAVMQGATSLTEAQFVVSVPRQEDIQVELISSSTDKVLLKTIGSSIVFDHSDWKLLQFRFSELEPGTSYRLRLKGESGNWVDERLFSTMPIKPKTLRVAIASCIRDDLKETKTIWKRLVSDSPHLVLMIGDNTYADIGAPDLFNKMTTERLWDRHMATRNKIAFFREKKLIPVLATWDDHDYGLNNGGRDFKLKKDSAKVFSSFFPMSLKKSKFSKGPGVARQLSLGNQNFILLDNRSFRAPKGAKTKIYHFGPRQVTWAMSQMKKNALNWLISGDQFFGGYHPFESFEGQHSVALRTFLRKIKATKAPSLFISGDRHMSEIMRVSDKMTGRSTYEITSSPIHSTVYPGAATRHKNQRRISAVSGQWNYVLIDVSTDETFYKLKTQSKGTEERVFFLNHLKVSR